MISNNDIVNFVFHPTSACETKINRQVEADLYKYGTTSTGLSPEDDTRLYTGQPIPGWTADRYFEYFSKELVRAFTGIFQLAWRLEKKEARPLKNFYDFFFDVRPESLCLLLREAASRSDLYITDNHFTEEMALRKDNISRIMCAFHPAFVLRANTMQQEYVSSSPMAKILRYFVRRSRNLFDTLHTSLEASLGRNVDACRLKGKLCELAEDFEEFFVSKSLWAMPKIALDGYKALYKEVEGLFEKLHDEVYLAEGKQRQAEEKPVVRICDEDVKRIVDESSEKAARLAESYSTLPAENDYLSDENLSRLFEASKSTIYNWRKGKVAAPLGFNNAFMSRDHKAMAKAAELYKANRCKGDAMNRKHVMRNMSEEDIYNHRADNDRL